MNKSGAAFINNNIRCADESEPDASEDSSLTMKKDFYTNNFYRSINY